ncbi:hypothetical protein [Synechococcus sp. CBW1006]|uniref:hypothetical protein n=1 Tax=Synechococcus sp. CBW1006 TaxID=1353138 RepID=UPI0018CE3F69|nr:hypothetical protein [Synechococcus sp. CBW1006]QPN65934.1 hypothetical protein H8F26_13865 [Synechococcus sp. CBW1006]
MAVADPSLDAVGLQLEQEQHPQRIVQKRTLPKAVEQTLALPQDDERLETAELKPRRW